MSILILYSLYLYVFGVLANRVIPGGTDTYDLHFNVADGMGNQAFTLIAALALFRTKGLWREAEFPGCADARR